MRTGAADDEPLPSSHDPSPPTFDRIVDAAEALHEYFDPTPVVRNDRLSDSFAADVYLKREDALPTGAFKVRGGLNVLRRLPPAHRDAGVITVSTGNFGLAVAYAGREFDVPVTVGVSSGASDAKVEAMRALGATVRRVGESYDDARRWVERTAAADDRRYVHPANEPALIAGVASAGVEVETQLPQLDRVVLPVATGSSAAGYCLTVGRRLAAPVVGVQASGSDAMYRALRRGDLGVESTPETIADAIALDSPFELPYRILRSELDDVYAVDDAAILEAFAGFVRDDHLVVEPAVGAPVAALDEFDVAGETVLVPVSGRNVTYDRMTSLLEAHSE